jgi:hypothetical protein
MKKWTNITDLEKDLLPNYHRKKQIYEAIEKVKRKEDGAVKDLVDLLITSSDCKPSM